RLAHDVARHWVAAGHSARALAVLRALLPRATEPALRLAVLPDLARAAAATGDSAAFMDAWTEAWELALAADDPPARAFLTLARAAASLGAWEKAEAAARHAQRGATDAAAETLLGTIARRVQTATAPATESAEMAAAAVALARDLAEALR
ncbi:MAG TPA: hypothetical protein VF613_20570, partial [Longimicrobium sp.]